MNTFEIFFKTEKAFIEKRILIAEFIFLWRGGDFQFIHKYKVNSSIKFSMPNSLIE